MYAADEQHGDAQAAPELETNPAAVGSLAEPCDECGAEPGEPCHPFCTTESLASI